MGNNGVWCVLLVVLLLVASAEGDGCRDFCKKMLPYSGEARGAMVANGGLPTVRFSDCDVWCHTFHPNMNHRLCVQNLCPYDKTPEGQNCGFVSWVDPEWPPTMQNALLKLWEMYQDSKSDRRNDNLESSLTIHHLTEEKNKLEANYDKLVENVHQLLNAQEDRVMDFRYLQGKMQSADDRRAEVTSSVVSDMKTEMDKRDAEMFKLQEKYAILMNLTRAQATVIRNLKANHLKEKEVASAAMRNLQFQVDELTKCPEKLTQENLKLKQVHECTKSQENLTQENLKLKDQIADMRKGHDELSQENLKLKDQIADMKKGHDELSQENIQLKDHMGDLKKGHDKLTKFRAQLKLQVADLLKAEEKNK